MVGRAFFRAAMDRDVKCRFDGVETWLRLYDLSAGGAMIELGGYALPAGTRIELTFSDLISVVGTVVWAIDGNAGVQFASVLSDWMLERLGIDAYRQPFEDTAPRDRYGQVLAAQDDTSDAPVEAEPSPDREPRLDTDIPVMLAPLEGEGVAGRLTNLSSDGCRFADRSGRFRPGEIVSLRIGNLEKWPGCVRWAMGGEIGIEFDRPLHPAVVDHLRQNAGSAPEQPDR